MLPDRIIFLRRLCLFQQDNVKSHSAAQHKKSVSTGLACLQSRLVSCFKCVVRYEVLNTAETPDC